MSKKLNEDTEIQVPLKNIITLVFATAVAVAAYFEITEKISTMDTSLTILSSDIEKNTDFRIRWPRGEMGALPADNEQFMLIEHLSKQFEKLSITLESGRAPFDQQQKLTLDFYEKRLENLEKQIIDLRQSIMDERHEQMKKGMIHD